jgi:hypothetical protein
MYARLYLSVMVAAAMLFGAEAPKPRPKLPPDLEPVVGLAMAAPPEFAADALLRLNSRVPEKELRRDVIDMAFRSAAKARNPAPLAYFAGAEPDTRQSYLAQALELDLDALSLESRAVEQMVPVDPARARELFGEMPRSWPALATCEDSLLPDVSAYYDAFRAVVQGGFSEKERAKSEHLTFAITQLGRISSMAELEPAAQMISSLSWPRPMLEIAVETLGSKLEAMAADSRSFLFYRKGIDAAMLQLIPWLRGLASPAESLVDSYRKFLAVQFKGPHCADTNTPQGKIVQHFQHTDLFGPEIRADAEPFSTEEMTPESIEGEMKLDKYWQSTEAQRVFQACLRLRQSENGQTLPEAARRTKEWERQLTDFLATLASWSPDAEASEADYYHQKATVYEAMLELAPPGDLSDRIIRNFVDFVKSSSLQQENPVEWFWHARATVVRVRPNHPEQAAKIVAAFRASGNITLMLDAMLEQIAPASKN